MSKAPIGVVIILERHCDSGSDRQIGQIGEDRRPIRSVNSTASCRKMKNPFHNPQTQVLASPNDNPQDRDLARREHAANTYR
jgi:hypothetical protein